MSSESFQTQAGRDNIRKTLTSMVRSVASVNIRFPENPQVFLLDPVVSQFYNAIIKATDTKNRIIEVENERAPSGGEIENVTRRVDDASVAIRVNVAELLAALGKIAGVYDRQLFEQEAGLIWSTTNASPASTSK